VQAKIEEQKRARELRAEGLTLRRIANELDVALSSVSNWVRDVEVPDPDAQNAIHVLWRRGYEIHPLRTVPILDGPGSFRRCRKCRRALPCTLFGRHRENGRQWWCKGCFRDYFAARGQKHLDQVKAAVKRRRLESRKLVAERRQLGCADCGERDPVILEFDHVAAKNGNVSDMVRHAVAPKRVAAEMDRCEVVCSNCHRIRTFSRMEYSWRLVPDGVELDGRYTPGVRRNLKYVLALLRAAHCADCGENDIRVLEFDHVDGKTGDVTVMARDGCSLARLEDEVDRCEIRCCNCHRRKTIRWQRARRAGRLFDA